MPSGMTPKLPSMQLRELQALGERILQFRVNFAVVDAGGQIAILLNAGAFDSDAQEIIGVARRVLGDTADRSGQSSEMPVWQFMEGHLFLAVSLAAPPPAAGSREPLGVAIIDMGDPSHSPASPVPLSQSGANCPATDAQYLGEMLRLIARDFQTAVADRRAD